MKVLIVEDDARVASLLQRGLSEEGHQVDACGNAQDARGQVEQVGYDVIVLDWTLPDADGLSLLRHWRQTGNGTPVLMLTARGSTGEKVLGLTEGADDYVVKPFDFDELLARLASLHRRARGGAVDKALGGVRLDVRRRALVSGERHEALTAREFALAQEFFAAPDDVLSRSRLLSAVWGSQFDGAPNIVDVYVGYLRSKLDALGAKVTVASVRGVGYRLAVGGSGA